jgi:predicted cobalt transporter CbtA
MCVVTETARVRFIAAKTRVAPHYPAMTIPRLELNASVSAARIVQKVDAALISRLFMWSDSTVVLGWLAQRTTLKTKYVVNRLINILSHLR